MAGRFNIPVEVVEVDVDEPDASDPEFVQPGLICIRLELDWDKRLPLPAPGGGDWWTFEHTPENLALYVKGAKLSYLATFAEDGTAVHAFRARVVDPEEGLRRAERERARKERK